MDTLISADDHWSLVAVLLLAAAFGLWAERTRIGAKLSGAVIAIVTTFVLANLQVIPSDAAVYDVVWRYLLPLAIPLLLFRADLRRIFKEAGPTLLAFAAGAVGTIVGTVIAFQVVPLGEEGAKLAGIFAATYIGGSMNYYGAAEALQLEGKELLTAGAAADNIAMAAYFFVLFTLPGLGWLQRRFPRRPMDAPAEKDAVSYWESRELRLHDLALALGLSALACAIGVKLEAATELKGSAILWTTALVVAAATLLPRQLGRIRGPDVAGTWLMQVFFAVIGAAASIRLVVDRAPVLLLFAALILAIHLAVILLIGRALRLDLREIVVASNANMGGPTTAAAMAVSRRWDALVLPAILCGTLGYAVATFIGKVLGEALA